MSSSSDPYLPPTDVAAADSKQLTIWRLLAFTIVLICVTPLAMTMRVLIAHYIGLSANPSKSYRPVLIFIPLYWSFITAVICIPLFIVVSRFGKPADAAVAEWGVIFPAVSVPLSMFGPFVICWLTGSSLGS